MGYTTWPHVPTNEKVGGNDYDDTLKTSSIIQPSTTPVEYILSYRFQAIAIRIHLLLLLLLLEI
jgi:hypothetical protein